MEKKFYTAFIYNHDQSAEVHCTHKYLGSMDLETFLTVVEAINSHDVTKQAAPVARFNAVEYFGRVRVLTTPDDEQFQGFWAELRAHLDLFRKDDFTYTPHVSSPTLQPTLSLPFQYYAICTGGEVIFSWKLWTR